MALCDWASVKEWQSTLHALKSNSTSPVSISLRADFNYVKALSRFEEGDLAECGTQLELLPGEDYSSLSGSKDKLGNTLEKILTIKINFLTEVKNEPKFNFVQLCKNFLG